MIVLFISICLAVLGGLACGFIILAPFTLPAAFRIWSHLPIATISACEVFLVCFYLGFLIVDKIAQKFSRRNGDKIAKAAYFVVVLLFSYLIVYTIREDYYLCDIPILWEISDAVETVYEKVYSFFESITTGIMNFLFPNGTL